MASIDISGAVGKAAAEAAIAQAAVRVEDPMAPRVKDLFLYFLQTYRLPRASSTDIGSGSQPDAPVYMEAARQMTRGNHTTLFVDYTHVAHFNPGLTDSIRQYFHRLQPYLNGVVHSFMTIEQPDHPSHALSLSNAADSNVFRAAFYNLPVISTIRDLKTGRIGELMSISGTVTRTSAVRPELSLGTFRCADCKTINANIEQQFKYTEVSGRAMHALALAQQLSVLLVFPRVPKAVEV